MMDSFLTIAATVFDEAGEEIFEETEASTPLVYQDGTVEVSAGTGDGERAYLRFALSDLVQIALTSEREVR